MVEPDEEIIPPRPNLGPEPWAEPHGWSRRLGPWLLALGLPLGLAWWRWRRIRGRTPAVSDRPIEPRDEPERTPRRRMIEASEGVRLALIASFGPAWGSRTTEEIAADPELAGRLDAEGLVAFLRLADRAKFAGDESIEAGVALDWADRFVAGQSALEPKPKTSMASGPRSPRSGRSRSGAGPAR